MVEDNSKSESEPNLRDLYPHLNEEELKEAEENLERYLELLSGIYERIRNDPEAYARFKEELKALKDKIDKEGKVA